MSATRRRPSSTSCPRARASASSTLRVTPGRMPVSTAGVQSFVLARHHTFEVDASTTMRSSPRRPRRLRRPRAQRRRPTCSARSSSSDPAEEVENRNSTAIKAIRAREGRRDRAEAERGFEARSVTSPRCRVDAEHRVRAIRLGECELDEPSIAAPRATNPSAYTSPRAFEMVAEPKRRSAVHTRRLERPPPAHERLGVRVNHRLVGCDEPTTGDGERPDHPRTLS